MITRDEIKNTAELCKLNISDEEAKCFQEDFSKILEYVDKLKEIDVEGVEATYHVVSEKQPLREDKIQESMPIEDVIDNAPEKQYGYFKLLRVMD